MSGGHPRQQPLAQILPRGVRGFRPVQCRALGLILSPLLQTSIGVTARDSSPGTVTIEVVNGLAGALVSTGLAYAVPTR